MIHFPKPYPVIKPGQGAWVNGVWVPAAEPQPVTVMLDVQPAGSNDYAQVQASPAGQRVTQLLVAYGEIGSLTPQGEGQGDIVLVGGERFLVLGKVDRNTLGNPDTDHARYLLARE